MSIRILVSDTVAVKVAGKYNDESGEQPFDFTLLCKRLAPAELEKRFKNTSETVEDFLLSVATGWRGVKDVDGEVPFSGEALRRLLGNYAQMTGIAFSAYLADVGAKAKN